MGRLSRDEMFMRIAEIVAYRGTCDRARVGAVLVKDNRIISIGYNGAPAGQAHCDEIGHKMENGHCVRTLHAEDNAIKFARELFTYGVDKLTLYCTHFPCMKCTVRIITVSSVEDKPIRIGRIVYLNDYGQKESQEAKKLMMEEVGIKVEQFTGDLDKIPPGDLHRLPTESVGQLCMFDG